jgi:hypothetical protein
MGVRRLVLHPGYQCERFNHDIALLELDGEVGWSETVWPACLPQGLCFATDFTFGYCLSHPGTILM